MTDKHREAMKAVDYDRAADGYNKRYETAYKQNGIASKLLDLVRTAKARRVLIEAARREAREASRDIVFPVDISLSMVKGRVMK